MLTRVELLADHRAAKSPARAATASEGPEWTNDGHHGALVMDRLLRVVKGTRYSVVCVTKAFGIYFINIISFKA